MAETITVWQVRGKPLGAGAVLEDCRLEQVKVEVVLELVPDRDGELDLLGGHDLAVAGDAEYLVDLRFGSHVSHPVLMSILPPR